MIPLLFSFYGEKSGWRLVVYAWITVFVQSIISFQWIYFVAKEFGSLSWVLSLLALIFFSLLTNFYLQLFALFFFIFRKISKKVSESVFYLLLVPSLYTIAEAVDPRIFNWSMGDAFSSYKYLPQLADAVGVHGLAFLCMLVNASLFLSMNSLLFKKGSKKIQVFLLASPIVLVTLFLQVYGYASFNKVNEYQDSCPTLKVGVVQANIGNPVQLKINETIKFKRELGLVESDDVSDNTLILGKYNNMSKSLVSNYPDLDLVVWPETAFPGYYNRENPRMMSHVRLIKELGVPFFIGGYYYKPDREGGRYYNSAILVSSEDDIKYYHKHMLLPFGEFMPLGEYMPFLKNLVPAVGDFARGKGPDVVGLNFNGIEARFAPTICYEVLKSNYVRKMISSGSNIILNFTNDSWFGVVEPYQHLRLTKMRAIENRRPIIRTTNTGITAYIDMNGQVVQKGGLLKEESFKFDVPVCNPSTVSFYTKYGWLFTYLLAFLCLVFYVSQFFTRRKK